MHSKNGQWWSGLIAVRMDLQPTLPAHAKGETYWCYRTISPKYDGNLSENLVPEYGVEDNGSSLQTPKLQMVICGVSCGMHEGQIFRSRLALRHARASWNQYGSRGLLCAPPVFPIGARHFASPIMQNVVLWLSRRLFSPSWLPPCPLLAPPTGIASFTGGGRQSLLISLYALFC